MLLPATSTSCTGFSKYMFKSYSRLKLKLSKEGKPGIFTCNVPLLYLLFLLKSAFQYTIFLKKCGIFEDRGVPHCVVKMACMGAH